MPATVQDAELGMSAGAERSLMTTGIRRSAHAVNKSLLEATARPSTVTLLTASKSVSKSTCFLRWIRKARPLQRQRTAY